MEDDVQLDDPSSNGESDEEDGVEANAIESLNSNAQVDTGSGRDYSASP